eukprot:TRINITY_DN45701_c0_g1_i1.p1 TRINITY_DN45701_c0_g1~~TRINITY_DN45701_c0_g1_i1.p1  ORF type:complete len:477 (+),score=155.50 TRINITY_DN45701_c0_g1_i1:66-1496(+)
MSFRIAVLALSSLQLARAASDVVVLTNANFNDHIQKNKQTLVEFYAPWCGHCKKLEPEYDKAAATLKDRGIVLGKVDATVEKDLATKYDVKGFPTMVWFDEGQKVDYDGGRTSDTIIDWVASMTGRAITEVETPPEPSGDMPRIVLRSASLNPGFEEAAKLNRRKASWYFVKSSSTHSVELQHKGEAPVQMVDGASSKEKILEFLGENILPLFGRLDGDTFDKYMEAGKGLVWSMFKPEAGKTFETVEQEMGPMMRQVAAKVKGRYFVTITDADKFKEAVENMLSVTSFPAIAVQKKAGSKHKYVYDGEMTEAKISQFIQDVEAGSVSPKLKSQPEPTSNDDVVRVVVGTTLQRELFTPDKDVLLEVYAPWCGHCKKLDPEYQKLAKKIKKEELTDLLTVAKIDGTSNDSPIDSVDWTGFPTIYFAKAGTNEATVYDGERSAKGLWKYIKKHATKAQEIRERLEKRKGGTRKGEEL